LVPKGSTYETKDSDFVVSDNLDFHPTDVIEAADGSLLIVDTGGWYKLCCPTSQLVKPDVTGAIYRVKKVGAHKEKTKPKAEPLPRLYTVALKRDAAGFDEAVAALKAADEHTRRLGATALGRIGDPKAIPAIFTALDRFNDRTLDHALTYALIEIGDAKALGAIAFSHPSGNSPQVLRAILAAMESISDSGLEAKLVLRYLDEKDADLRETAWWIAGRHPQWGDQLAGYFKERLAIAEKLKPAERDELADRLAKFAGGTEVQKLLGRSLDKDTPEATARVVLRAMLRSGVRSPHHTWYSGVQDQLPRPNLDLVRDAVAVMRAVPWPPDVYRPLTEKAHLTSHMEQKWPLDLRLAFAAAEPAPFLDEKELKPYLALLAKKQPPEIRSLAADIIARSTPFPETLVDLAAGLKTATPLELPKLIGVFAKSKKEAVGLALVKALRDPALRASIRVEMVKPILDKYPKTVQAEAEKLYAELAEARKGETAKLEAMLANLKNGDVRRGQLVFNSPKTNCIACHKVGYVGGLVGPDLTKIGGIRTERDLLESIVFPSGSFVRSYEPVRVVTTDERTFNGVLKKDAPDEIIVVVAADKEERIARADVASISPSSVSLMPAGLDQQLTPQEIADLVAFLRACK
jgi:putative heme-binding domain-containing protein